MTDITSLTSNINPLEIFIEQNIEKKINQLLDTFPSNIKNINIENKNYYNYTLNDIYKGTLQTTIDIIDDITALFADKNFISTQIFRERLFNIFFNNDRKLFIGIILIFLSLIIYFIDGTYI